MAKHHVNSERNITGSFLLPILLVLAAFFLYYLWRKKRRNAVILFTRYPKPGKAKTRLIPHLGPDGAAALQVCMTEHILKALQQLCLQERTDTQVVIQYNGGTLSEMKYWLSRKLNGLPCKLEPQCGNDLGEKLMLAVQDSFKKGHEKVIVIGGDIPGINSDILNGAIERLNQTDIVIGKAEDGGYYLIGLNVKAARSIDRLFHGINWGTDTVYREQVTVARDLNLTVTTLPQILQDVDTVEDIGVFEREVGVSCESLQNRKWSVIIPVLNEEVNITSSLKNILKNVSIHSNICDIIVSDGGSSDGTCAAVKNLAETSNIPVILTHSRKGRGYQLVEGAKKAKGDYYLFVHADTELPKNFDIAALECLQVPGNVAGAYNFRLDLFDNPELKAKESWWMLLQMYLLEVGTTRRCRSRELPYGDQALFMSKTTYQQIGGYPHYYLMEDFVMIEKLHCVGHVAITQGYNAVTSYRRWRKHGLLKITGFNQIILMAYRLGVHPDTLARWYYGDKVKFD